MRFILMVFLTINLHAFNFGLKINKMNSSEVDNYFNNVYGKGKKYNCILRSSYVPNTTIGKNIKKMLNNQIAYINFRSIACNINNTSYFFWILFNNDVLKQIKYEVFNEYTKLLKELKSKHKLIKETKTNIDYYISNYDEFNMNKDIFCDSNKYCKNISFFDFNQDTELILVDISDSINKKCVIILRDKNLLNNYRSYINNPS